MSGDRVAALAGTISGGGWVAGGLGGSGSTAALDATVRPVDALAAAGLGFLTSHVQPLQDVCDRMAGKAEVVRTFADTWQQVATRVEEVRERLVRSSATDTAQWGGAAGDRYRARTAEIASALAQVVALALAGSAATTAVGTAVAGGRQQAGDLLTDLVQRLISFALQAIAVEGGITSTVLAESTGMISSYRAPISAVEQRVRQTITNVTPLLTALADAVRGAPTTASTTSDGSTSVASAQSAAQVAAPNRPEAFTTTAAAADPGTTRGVVFAQAQAGGGGGSRQGGTVLNIPGGKVLRPKPGGVYTVPSQTEIYENGVRVRPEPNQTTIRLRDGTIIRLVPEDRVPTS
ncbi:hypothetical protein [Umezawaea sp.]|uniref:WXG100 family type VII secretion target n=1 Tax=Umezawaea sp. TaxID=1955258 RepID=UPI002ED5D638